MLKLTDIVKTYKSGDTSVTALKGVSIEFRKNEFVSILGPSGCGKTTLLNIIGGLDRYDSGDLRIVGRSTKEYKDSDWDGYRNHSIGFVFQSYNLIPHQSILSNVELALTLSGVSKSERRKRAKEVLSRVGLGDQLHKKPNQMSGGQMQRVAIARALVNNPEILLADEPTGALDSETSVQIMDILKEISSDRLVIMVTHNPELAEKYSTRTVRLLDGAVTDDSDPYDSDAEAELDSKREKPKKKKRKQKKGERTSMSFLTALSLSMNNLMTKKGRTFMTSFAGSIGIIGIALILSLSNGFQLYIDSVQKDALSNYPLTIEGETINISSMLESMATTAQSKTERPLDRVYSNPIMNDMMGLVSADITTNNLAAFKEYIESDECNIEEYLSAPIQYSYKIDLNVFKSNVSENGIVQLNPSNVLTDLMGSFGLNQPADENASGGISSMMSSMNTMSGANVWTEIIDSEELLSSQYEIVTGRWPQSYDELVIVTDKNNQITDYALYALGLLPNEELVNIISSAMSGEKYVPEERSFTYEELLDTTFSLVIPADYYSKNPDTGLWENMSSDDVYMNELVRSAEQLKIVGIVRPDEEATTASITGTIGYTSALTEYVINETNKREIVKEQLAAPEIDIFTGLKFREIEEKEKLLAEQAKPEEETTEAVTEVSKGALNPTVAPLAASKAPSVTPIADAMSEEEVYAYIDANLPEAEREAMKGFVELFLKSSRNLSERKQLIALLDELLGEYEIEGIGKITGEQAYSYIALMNKTQKLEMITSIITGDMSQLTGDIPQEVIDEAEKEQEKEEEAVPEEPEEPEVVAAESFDVNAKLLGIANLSDPTRINFYPVDFEAKEYIAEIIENYNNKMAADGKEEYSIEYTDYIAVFMSSITLIINVVSYVLIAFVSISLVVSSIMIGIITYISVLERTKEIGILRSIGASKRDISRVFNAETLIVGLTSGVIGILMTLLLNIPINMIIKAIVNISDVSQLPLAGAIGLIIISVILTVIAGLIPSRFAAKKDPVVALRTE